MTSIDAANLNPEPVARLLKNGRMVNRILASICGQENLSKIGVKAELQNRIIDKLFQHAANNDVPKFERLKTMIENPSIIPSSGQYLYVAKTGSPSIAAKNTMNTATNPSLPLIPGNLRPGHFNDVMRERNWFRTHGSPAVQLKNSPYYTIVEQLGSTVIFEVMATHRYTAKIPISVSQYPILNRLAQEPDLRVMVFGVSEGYGPQDVAFPHQSELRVNGGEVKANLRGLKNRPGSTRPVDITDNIRFHPSSYVNNIEMTYALTNKAGVLFLGISSFISGIFFKFYLLLCVIQMIPVPKLVQLLVNGQKITEKSVVADMLAKARDTDIIATASVLSLKCPLSTRRIDLPCRSTSCRHTQCFDATSYLQLQEQGPTWSCPICNNPAPFESLAVDEYVKNILQKTSKSVEQVTIQPDGRWELHDSKETSSRIKGTSKSLDGELVDITLAVDSKDPFPWKITEAYSRISQPILAGSCKEKAPVSTPTGITNSLKRPIATVIDLTSSGDEDEDPCRREPKRQCTSS
ncbi:E3 SUMO-protein ligase pli1 [Golovinomyces cichoracearum]|uniref:E3 SUMO-protein ligase pli1 n=1 Tax=Golovinomyces cichoracearum TaxID=62708 RepID=A0A420IB34_9PEZI|nr:E3 SUMO-protein ligase pli1 [Golovinomyces cichoracearum]